jgi:hypothetical protein
MVIRVNEEIPFPGKKLLELSYDMLCERSDVVQLGTQLCGPIKKGKVVPLQA